MIDFYKNLMAFMKIGNIHTDNNVFKLHYKVTVILIATFSVLLTSKQYFGEPIDCDVQQRKEIIDTYCWINGTFIFEDNILDYRAPGLTTRNDKSGSAHFQNYYQWVCIVFALQAICFYIPRYIWKACEGGRLKQLVGEFGGPITSEKWNNTSKEKLVRNILYDSYAHNVYTFRYCFCEFLNLVNVIINILFMDWFLDGEFSTYGLIDGSRSITKRMNRVFPKLAKCHYYKFGPSGDMQLLDALCILSLNVLNQKVFLLLWYWLLVLLIVSFLSVLYRALFLFVPVFRTYLLRAQARRLENKKAKYIVRKLSYGDFFILYRLGKNVNQNTYRDVVSCIYDHLSNWKGYKIFQEI
ncbi:unnamed protein product [Phyllotreta striolata]|uniref:Innexin n=1 Tax=Phyllotreta striolata TaxID=444603 RepID=A0A9N9XSX4_PHYSR|nr:unnamed protein product [Phyllotreta striolata]